MRNGWQDEFSHTWHAPSLSSHVNFPADGTLWDTCTQASHQPCDQCLGCVFRLKSTWLFWLKGTLMVVSEQLHSHSGATFEKEWF